jgi:riboflavin biosynthesis pyrimidine reductase
MSSATRTWICVSLTGGHGHPQYELVVANGDGHRAAHGRRPRAQALDATATRGPRRPDPVVGHLDRTRPEGDRAPRGVAVAQQVRGALADRPREHRMRGRGAHDLGVDAGRGEQRGRGGDLLAEHRRVLVAGDGVHVVQRGPGRLRHPGDLGVCRGGVDGQQPDREVALQRDRQRCWGATTTRASAASGPPSRTNPEADTKDREFSRWLNAVEKVVFSTTLTETTWDNSRIAATDPATAVKELRQQDGGDIIVLASTSVIQNLIAAGELDRLSITLCPELVGGGPRLFPDGPDATSWRLTDSTPTESGALCLLYDRA